MILELLFWMSVLVLFHSYILFPFILKLKVRKKLENQTKYCLSDPLPYVSVIMAVHNEEQVIVEKIKSIFYTDYPLGKFEVIVGSDASTDGTNRILEVFSNNYDHFHFRRFKKRMGKPEIINLLTAEAKGDIIIITDANVFLQESTLFEIVRHFKNPDIGLVDTKMFHRGEAVHGISYQENTYMNWEYNIKEMESKAWGTMMGPFGGCFAIRRKLFVPIPENYLVDDFYLNMLVLSRKYKAILSSQAVVTEDVSIDLREELRRKIRIAAGNFQNLSRFLYLLWPPYSPESFCFLSHKVLRWLGPFFIIMAFITNIFLADKPLYGYLLIIQIIIFLIPLADFLMKKLRFNIVALRFITHFLSMNLALLIGFTRYISGINSNIWQPTRRNQGE